MLFCYILQHIVGLSAHANGNDAELGLKAGMNRFMSKPIPLQTLKDLASE
jgi:CheY-like chemotaxis protein